MSVRVVSERALIVWDAANQTEHFIRGAVFDTTVSDGTESIAKDFGFLVPTPTTPDLAEADPQVFNTLHGITEPKVVWKKQREAGQPRSLWRVLSEIVYGIQPPMTSAVPGIICACPPSAQVLKQQQVAGYDAVVLAADKPELILQWLKENGYEANENLIEWLRWYTDHQWVITAFKISVGDGQQATHRLASNQLVRISFRTERPFYPYREPQEPENQSYAGMPGKFSRTLQVYYVSDQAGLGLIGNGEFARQWTAGTEWRDAITRPQIPLLNDLSHAERALPEKLWLTEFLDFSSPRLGTDEVYFAAEPNATVIHRPDIVYIDREKYYPPSWIVARIARDLLPLVVVGLAIVGVWRWRSTTIKLPRKNIAK